MAASVRDLRACMFCSRIKTIDDFLNEGCDNCYKLVNTPEAVRACTTTKFSGMIAMNKSNESWVARWQQIGGRHFKPGLYAVSISDIPRNNYIAAAERHGIRYVNRDMTS